jgi:hypothetical protein
MNSRVERILREFESTHAFGSVEVIFINGVAVTLHVKKTHKLTANSEPNRQREQRDLDEPQSAA